MDHLRRTSMRPRYGPFASLQLQGSISVASRPYVIYAMATRDQSAVVVTVTRFSEWVLTETTLQVTLTLAKRKSAVESARFRARLGLESA